MFNNFLIFLKKLKLGMFYLIFSTWQTILNKENIEIIYVYERDINWVDTVKWGIISIIIVLGVLLLVAYAILLERKVLGSIQKRRGPNLVGIFGLLQPIADAVKLIVKETIIPVLSNRIIFIIAPLLTLILSLLNWSIIPFSNHAVLADIRVSILMFFAISSLSVYGIIMSGWASNSKYAFLGALRAAAQVIAYEVSIGLTLIYILIQTSDLNYFKIIWSQLDIWNIIPCFIFFFLFFISTLAETNRPPFDLPEAEAELVSGYNVEYSAMSFGFFFLGEYVSIWTVCCLNVILFWGGFLIYTYESIFIYSLKVILLVITFIWVRGSLPRYRYDQLMRLGWKILLPISLGFVILYAGIYYDLFYKQLLKEYDHYMDKILVLEEVENNTILFNLTDKELIDLFSDAENIICNDIIFTDLSALSENINDEEVVNFFLELDCYYFTLEDIFCELCYNILNIDILYDEEFLKVTEQDVNNIMLILEQQLLEDIKIAEHNFLIEQELINMLLTIDEELINLTEQELINLTEQELINILLILEQSN